MSIEPYRVLSGITGPCELKGAAEALVTPGQGRVDDVLAIAANGHKTTWEFNEKSVLLRLDKSSVAS